MTAPGPWRPIALLLLLAACSNPDNERAGAFQACVRNSQMPAQCAEAAFRLYPAVKGSPPSATETGR